MNDYLPSPRESATLIAHLLITARAESGRAMTRARMAPKTVKRVCNRERLHEGFVDDVALFLLNDHGLVLIPTSVNGSDVFALMEQDVVSTWTSLTSKPIRDDLKRLREATTDENRESIIDEIEGRVYEAEGEREDEELDRDDV